MPDTYTLEFTGLAASDASIETKIHQDEDAIKIEVTQAADGTYTLRATYKKPPSGGTNKKSGAGSGPAGVAGGTTATASTPGASAESLSASFRQHGTFIYNVAETIADYGTLTDTVEAMQRAGMHHAWVRIHGTHAYGESTANRIKELIEALDNAGIAVAAWGWCQGADPMADAKLAAKELKRYGLSDYLADIEHGTQNAHWTTSEIEQFCQAVRPAVAGSFAVTTYPLIDWHEPELMVAAQPFVDAFAPQVYWFNHPNKKMIAQFSRPDGSKYRPNDPSEYAYLCLDRWIALMGKSPKPLILTGQAYWGESGFSQEAAEQKLRNFLDHWAGYARIAGLNWWHFGGGAAMSHTMFEAIVAAKLGEKTYAP